MTPFSAGPLTTSQAQKLTELARMMEQFTRLTVSPPLNISRPAGIPCISIAQTGFSSEFTQDQENNYGITSNDSWETTPVVATAPVTGRYLISFKVDGTVKISAGLSAGTANVDTPSLKARISYSTGATNGPLTVVTANALDVTNAQSTAAVWTKDMTEGETATAQVLRQRGTGTATFTTSLIDYISINLTTIPGN